MTTEWIACQRHTENTDWDLEVGELRLSLRRYEAYIGEACLKLTGLEFILLEKLMSEAGARIVARSASIRPGIAKGLAPLILWLCLLSHIHLSKQEKDNGNDSQP